MANAAKQHPGHNGFGRTRRRLFASPLAGGFAGTSSRLFIDEASGRG